MTLKVSARHKIILRWSNTTRSNIISTIYIVIWITRLSLKLSSYFQLLLRFKLMCFLNRPLHIIWIICWLPYKISFWHNLIFFFYYFFRSYIFLFRWKVVEITWVTLKFRITDFQLSFRFKLMIFWDRRSNICLMTKTITLKCTFWEYLILFLNYFLCFYSRILSNIVHCVIWLSFKFTSDFEIILKFKHLRSSIKVWVIGILLSICWCSLKFMFLLCSSLFRHDSS